MRRFLIAAMAFAALMVATYFLRVPEPVRFKNRLVVRAPWIMRFLYRTPKRAEINAYVKLVDQSLLIRATSLVDNPAAMGGGFTFPEVAAKAFAPVGVTDASEIDGFFRATADSDGNVYYLLNNNWGTGHGRTLQNIPLRLLAVVNRLDQAVVGCEGVGGCQKPGRPPCVSDHLCGAEVRFVYAGVASPPAPYFTLIVEFSLLSVSKADFVALANKWADLQKANPDDSAFPMKVGDVLRYCWSLPGGGMTARMRVNAKTNDGQWKLRQYKFTANGLVADPLFQQFAENFHSDSSCQSEGSLYAFVGTKHDAIIQNIYEYPEAPLQTDQFDLQLPNYKNHRNVLTLADTLGYADLGVVRHNLSVNSCSGCHGWETRLVVDPDSLTALAPFDQIQYREPGSRSELSAFLTGNKTGTASGEPTLDSWMMTPPAISDASHGCSGKVWPVPYNDLLRREAYFLAVLGLLPSDSDEVWYKTLASNATLGLD